MYDAPILKKALDVLKLLCRRGEPLGVTEIATILAISKSTTYGILQALGEEGLIHKDTATKKYSVGRELENLARLILKGQDIIAQARPILERLVQEVEESVFLGMRENDTVKVIEVVEAKKSIKITAPVGMRLPITAGAIGKLFLSTRRDREIIAFLKEKGLPRYTDNSITDLETFLQEIRKTRELGYSTDREEYLRGVNALATFIYQDGNPVGAIWLVGFSHSLPGEKLPDLVNHLLAAAKEIGLRLSAGH